MGLDGIFRINIGPSTQQTTLAWTVNYNHATSGQIVAIGSAVAFNGASNSPAYCDLIRFKMASGNISDGNIRLYGIA